MRVRRLILMRHGQAEPGHGLPDHERSLTPDGRGEAERVGRAFVAAGWIPEFVRSSDAARTRQSWASVAGAVSVTGPVSFTRDLYLPTLERLAADAAGWAPELHTCLCLGHNPGWSDAASRLSGHRIGMGTANAALLEAEGDDWADAFTRRWTLVDLLRP